MEVINTLIEFDTNLLLLLNSFNVPFFDRFMLLVSNKWVWIPFYAAVILTVARYYKKDFIFILPALILLVVFADQISSGLLKEWFQRLRPTREKDLLPMLHIVNGYKGGGMYGFVSSHAANTFGFAVLTALLFKNRLYGYSVFTWAIIVSYSRIYLAVHYPFDILGGFIVGAAVAFSIYKLLGLINKRLIQPESYSLSTAIPSYTLIASFVLIMLYSAFLFL